MKSWRYTINKRGKLTIYPAWSKITMEYFEAKLAGGNHREVTFEDGPPKVVDKNALYYRTSIGMVIQQRFLRISREEFLESVIAHGGVEVHIKEND